MTGTATIQGVAHPAYDRIHFATMALESGARRLGITESNVRKRYERAKKMMRQNLGQT